MIEWTKEQRGGLSWDQPFSADHLWPAASIYLIINHFSSEHPAGQCGPWPALSAQLLALCMGNR